MICQDSVRKDIPWYVNNTLPAEEHAAVEAHLQTCAECADYATVLQTLSDGLAVRIPAASPPAVESLLARLPDRQPLVAAQLRPQFNWQWAIMLIRVQARVVRGEIWPASALVMVLGLVITLAAADAWPLVLAAPLIAAVGVAFIYGPSVNPALEIELATPTLPRLVLLARLALVFGYDLALGVLGSVVFALLHAEVSLWPLVMSWLAPMAFLSSLALLLTVLSADPGLGALVSLVSWVLLNVLGTDSLSPYPISVPDVLAVSVRPWLLFGSLALALLALLISGREERWLGRGA